MKSFLGWFGWTLCLCGVALGVSGLAADVTIQVGGEYVPLVGYVPASEQVNLHLMFGALLRLVAGGFLLTAGAVLAVGGEVLKPRGAAEEGATSAPRKSDLRPVLIGAAFLVTAVGALALQEETGSARQGPGEDTAAVDAATDADQLASDAAADAAHAAAAVSPPRPDQISPPAGRAGRREATPDEVAEINRRLAEFEAPGT